MIWIVIFIPVILAIALLILKDDDSVEWNLPFRRRRLFLIFWLYRKKTATRDEILRRLRIQGALDPHLEIERLVKREYIKEAIPGRFQIGWRGFRSRLL